MSARQSASSLVYLPALVEENFLAEAVETLERLSAESEWRGHGFLASLLVIAKGEAEDGIKTLKSGASLRRREEDHDDGVAKMAQKLAWRGSGQMLFERLEKARPRRD